MVEPQPHQGDVYWTDPEPTRGRVQAKSRAFVIVSVHLAIPGSEGGLKEEGFAMPEQLSAISHERLSRRLEELLKRCRVLLR